VLFYYTKPDGAEAFARQRVDFNGGMSGVGDQLTDRQIRTILPLSNPYGLTSSKRSKLPAARRGAFGWIPGHALLRRREYFRMRYEPAQA
jgi:hypothetical protein